MIFDGNGNFNLFNVKAGNYNYTRRGDDSEYRHRDRAGTQFLGGSKGLTVKHCRFENVGLVLSNSLGSSDSYIADNTFIGRDDPDHLIGWSGNYWASNT